MAGAAHRRSVRSRRRTGAEASTSAPAARGGARPGAPARRGRRTGTRTAAAEPPRGARGAARVCVMVSGGGSNLRALHAAAERGALGGGEIVVVVSDRPGCSGWAFAEERGIATVDFSSLDGPALAAALAETHGVDVVLLAGFLKLVPAPLCERFERAMLNIHPALLPAFGGKGFYGERVHAAVVASGARVSGPTVHFVTSEYDRGPILAQRAVRVLPTDTAPSLAARVLEAEHELYAEAAAALCAGRVVWREDGVPYYDDGA